VLAAWCVLAPAAALVGSWTERPAITFLPECERPLGTLVIGIGTEGSRYFMLPEARPCEEPRAGEEIAAELYALDVELSHGALLRRLPERTHLYVAAPATAGVAGREKEFFRRYLGSRCGWTPQDLERRLHFFEVSAPIVFAQDPGKVLGYDGAGRRVIATSSADDPAYRAFVQALVSSYPDTFTRYDLGAGLSAEGGDQEIVRLPGGGLGVLLGHRRVQRYYGIVGPKEVREARLDPAQIQKAVAAYSRALADLPLQVLPRGALLNPSLANPDLYHLDMSVCVLSTPGMVDAFVPTFRDAPVDRMTGQALAPDYVGQVQTLFDLAAGELGARGYAVTRLPFWDHPARTPVNVCKFRDPTTGRTVVMLPKYPDHDPAGARAQQQVNALLQRTRDEFAAVSGCAAQRALVRGLWEQILAIEALPNPLFETRKRLIESRGYDVVEVPMFAWGGGSLHCLTMH